MTLASVVLPQLLQPTQRSPGGVGDQPAMELELVVLDVIEVVDLEQATPALGADVVDRPGRLVSVQTDQHREEVLVELFGKPAEPIGVTVPVVVGSRAHPMQERKEEAIVRLQRVLVEQCAVVGASTALPRHFEESGLQGKAKGKVDAGQLGRTACAVDPVTDSRVDPIVGLEQTDQLLAVGDCQVAPVGERSPVAREVHESDHPPEQHRTPSHGFELGRRRKHDGRHPTEQRGPHISDLRLR